MIAIVHPESREQSLGSNPESKNGKNGSSELGNPAKFADSESLLRQAVEEQEQVLQMSDFLRRAITTVIALSARNENGMVSEGLAEFKRAVLEGRSMDSLEASLHSLKHLAMQSDMEGMPVPAGNLWDKFRVFSRKPQQEKASHLEEIKSIYTSIVDEFDHDLGEAYSSQFAMLRKDIEESADLEHLIALKQDVLVFIQAYNRILNEERNQITDFIAEIGNCLVGIERQFEHSVSQSEQSHSSSTAFNSMIELHIEDMKNSAQISTTLAEFKNLVVSRLASIREALEEKRKVEALRQETINEEMQSLQQNVNRMKKEIDLVQEKRKALEKEVLIDQLTGVANRRAFKRRLKEELQRYQRYQHYFSMLLFDIDHFKGINDRFGHWAGDKCLKELIKRIKPMLRESDFLARWGGEEFVILLAGTDMENAAAVAERIRKAVENTRFVYHKQEISFTVSVGVSEVMAADVSQETIFNRVDKAMYEAKRRGRNQVFQV